MSGVSVLVFASLLALSIGTASVSAQGTSPVASPSGGVAQAPPAKASASPASTHTQFDDPALQRSIILPLDSVPIITALQAIGSAAQINFIYRTNLIPPAFRVSLDKSRRSVSDALAIVLRNTGLRFLESRVGDIVITPDPEWVDTIPRPIGKLPPIDVLGQRVVTGSMVNNTMREMPNAVTVLFADGLEAQGIRTIEQLFRGQVPGIVAFDQGSDVNAIGTSALQVRGTAGFTALNAPLKTYVDGVEMSDPTFINHIEAKSIDRIEIALGPQASTLYGSGALTGVMQIFTKRGTLTMSGESQLMPSFSATLSGGWLSGKGNSMAPLHDYAINMSGGSPYLSYNLGAGYAFDGAHAGDNYSTAASRNRFLTLGARAKIGRADPSWRNGGAIETQLTGRINDRMFGASADQFYAQGMASGQLAYNPYRIVPYNRPGKVREQTVGATFNWDLGEWLQQRVIIGQDRQVSQFSAAARYVTTDDSLPSFDRGVGRRNTLAYHATLRGFLPTRQPIRWTVTAGIDAWSYRFNSTYTGPRPPDIQPAPGAPPGMIVIPYIGRQSHSGFFGQGQLGIRNTIFLTAGLRIENELGGDAGVSPYLPRFGIAYIIENLPGNATLKLRGSFGRAARLPCPGCKNGALAPFGLIAANPRLTPETQTGGEAGIDLFWKNWIALQATYFEQLAESFILAVRTSAPEVALVTYQYRNGGNTRNRGIELQNTTRVGPLTLRATYTYTDARLRAVSSGLPGGLSAGDRALFVAPTTGAFSATYARPRWRISTGVSYVGSYRDFNDEALSSLPVGRLPDEDGVPTAILTQPAQARVNLSGSYDIRPGVQLFARGDNLNNRYGLSVSRNVAGRRMVAGVRLSGK